MPARGFRPPGLPGRWKYTVAVAVVAAVTVSRAAPGQDFRAAEGVESFSALEGELVSEVPIEVEDRWLVVPVEGHGQAFRFIMDTGATTGAVSKSVARRLGLEPVAAAKLSGASGQARAHVVSTRVLRLGAARAGEREKYVLDDEVLADGDERRFDGIVGSDLLKYYDVLIDAPAGVLRVYRRGTTDSNSGGVVGPSQAVPFERVRRGIIRLEVEVNGSVVDAVLDSGSPALILNAAAAEAANLQVSEHPVSEQVRGLGSEKVSTFEARIDSIRVGPTVLRSLPGEVADLPIFGRLGLDDRPAMLLGSPVLLRCAVLISWRDRTLRFCRHPLDEEPGGPAPEPAAVDSGPSAAAPGPSAVDSPADENA